MNVLGLLDTVAKIAGVVAAIAGSVMGAKLWQWRAQLRGANAAAAKDEAGAKAGNADATETFVQTALLLANPALVNAIGQRLTVLERWAEEEKAYQIDTKDWQTLVIAAWVAAGLPPLPDAPTPPPFPRPGDLRSAAGGVA